MHLAVGQEWRFNGRPTDPDPRLTIVRLESNAEGEVVHICVRGVRIRNPHVRGGAVAEIPHLPMSRDAIERSVIELIGRGEPSARFEEGYGEWERAHGGVFEISVAQCLALAESRLD